MAQIKKFCWANFKIFGLLVRQNDFVRTLLRHTVCTNGRGSAQRLKINKCPYSLNHTILAEV